MNYRIKEIINILLIFTIVIIQENIFAFGRELIKDEEGKIIGVNIGDYDHYVSFYPSENLVIFTIENRSKVPIDLENAHYLAMGYDGTICRLKFVEIINENSNEFDFILNPYNAVSIKCKTPVKTFDVLRKWCENKGYGQDYINGFYIKLRDGNKIIFGYIPPLTLYEKIQEWIKENIGMGKYFYIFLVVVIGYILSLFIVHILHKKRKNKQENEEVEFKGKTIEF